MRVVKLEVTREYKVPIALLRQSSVECEHSEILLSRIPSIYRSVFMIIIMQVIKFLQLIFRKCIFPFALRII